MPDAVLMRGCVQHDRLPPESPFTPDAPARRPRLRRRYTLSGRAAAQSVPGATFIKYDGEPHILLATVPGLLNADTIGFIG